MTNAMTGKVDGPRLEHLAVRPQFLPVWWMLGCAWWTIWLNSCMVASSEISCCSTGLEPLSSVSWLVDQTQSSACPRQVLDLSKQKLCESCLSKFPVWSGWLSSVNCRLNTSEILDSSSAALKCRFIMFGGSEVSGNFLNIKRVGSLDFMIKFLGLVSKD